MRGIKFAAEEMLCAGHGLPPFTERIQEVVQSDHWLKFGAKRKLVLDTSLLYRVIAKIFEDVFGGAAIATSESEGVLASWLNCVWLTDDDSDLKR